MSEIFTFFENKLKRKLSKLKVEELIVEMNNMNYYFPYNIWKKYFDKKSIISGKMIAWFATRQAEKLNDKSDFEKLKNIIDSENSNSQIIRRAYFCIGCLSKNTKDKMMFDYLMKKLEDEEDEFTKITILSTVQEIEKTNDYNLKPIINILKEGSISLKTSAAMALKNSTDSDVEIELLNSLQNEKNKHLHSMIATTLREIGSERSLPVLENLLKNAKGRDYKFYITNAIENIKSR